MATKVVCGWIKKGVAKPIAQSASRTRVNVVAAIELAAMKMVSSIAEYVNAGTIVDFLGQLKIAYAHAPKIHLILDQLGYHRSQFVQNMALERNIELHYLPPYSPNLHSIERLRKVMNEECRNNVFFPSAKAFRNGINGFFDETLPQMAQSLRGRINDNFQTIKPAPSG